MIIPYGLTGPALAAAAAILDDVASVVVPVAVPVAVPSPLLEAAGELPEADELLAGTDVGGVLLLVVVVGTRVDVEEQVSPPLIALQKASAAGITVSEHVRERGPQAGYT